MSQSSPSADSRKRKEIAEATTSGESSQSNRAKRRRTILSLNRRCLEDQSTSFIDNSSQDHEYAQSDASLSFSNASLPEKNESSKKYQFYASKYGIQLQTVEKYYEILTAEPRVPLIKAVPIKKELSPIPLDEDIRLSPILGSRRKLRKPKIKKENITPTKKDISKRASENITDDFKPLPVKVKEEVLSSDTENFNSSTEFQKTFQNDRKGSIGSNLPENAFKHTKNSKSTKNINSEKSASLVANPFSKKKKNLPDMRRNKKILSTNEKITKKKKIASEIGNEMNKTILIDDSDNDKFTDLTVRKKITKQKTRKSTAKDDKEAKVTKVGVGDKLELGSIDSLAVNCQSLCGISNINVKRKSTSTSANGHEENLISFGTRPANEANNVNFDQPTSFAGNNVLSDKENGNALNNSAISINSNTDDESHHLNSSSVSLGICDSPTKLDTKSPIKANPISCSTPEKCNNDITKPKAKPKIISDKIIGMCPEKTGIASLSIAQKRLQLKSRPNSPITFNKPSKFEKLSSEITYKYDSSTQSADSNGAVKKVHDAKLSLSSKTPALDGWTANSEPSKNLNSDITLSPKGDKQKHKQKPEVPIEESFESICNDISQLSRSENITLYKGEEIEGNAESRQISLSSKGYYLQNKSEVETQVTRRSGNISPIKILSIPRFKFKIKKNIREGSSSPGISATALPKQQQQQQQKQQQQQQRQQQQNESSPVLVRNKNPRMDRSFGPKSVEDVRIVEDLRLNGSFNALDSRLNTSCSPTKAPVTKDPRLLRGNSQPRTSIPSISLRESPEKDDTKRETIIDPRLRKRKEREDAEQATKMVKEDIYNSNDSGIFVCPQNRQFTSRSAIYNRLGGRTDSLEKEVIPEKDVIQSIVKDARSISPSKSTTSDNEDNISLFAGDTFSSDEESNTSPRHRKFTSERLRENEERNQSILHGDLRGRVGWNNNTNLRRPTIANPVFTPVSRPPLTVRGSLNTTRPLRTPVLNSSMHQTSINVTGTRPIKTPINEFGNNNSEFNDDFFKMNAAQMQKDVANLRSDFENNPYLTFDSDTSPFDQKSMLDGPYPGAVTSIAEQNKVKHFFTKYCFKMLKTGKCAMHEAERCHFVHQIQVLKCLLQKKTEKEIMQILEYAFNSNYDHFISFIWEAILPILQDSAFSVFQKLYNKEVVLIDKFLLKLLDYCISSKLHTVESFVKRISPIVRVGDNSIVRSICVAIKGKLTDGFCWEAIKDLCHKAVPPRDMIELTLIQCLKRKKNRTHILEVNDLITKKMTPAEREVLSTEMLTNFNALVKSLNPLPNETEFSSTKPLKSVPVTNASKDLRTVLRVSTNTPRCESVNSAQSLEQQRNLTARLTAGTSAAIVRRKLSSNSISPSRSDTPSVLQPHNSPLQPGASTPKTGETFNFDEYSVQELDVEQPKSIYRERFWKLYIAINSVNEGLAHLDYEYVWKVMDEFSKQEGPEVLKNAYYHLLCKNVRNSEKHLSEIIKQAVRGSWSTANQSFDVLFDVGVSALINLANSDLWVMALQLLGWVKILEPEQPKTAFVLISAEIYIANNDPLEALYLLRRTGLIRTNRDEWLVKDSTQLDEKHRNKIVFILLKALSFIDSEKATYLFKALMADQYNAHYPIDLPLYLDKLTLLLLIYKKEELVSEVCSIVMDNDLTFQKETYQELLRYMLGYDEVLADQLLDYAIHLGYYSDIQIRDGYTTLIINMNSCEEELYLIFKRLIRKLLLNIGPALYRMKQTKLKVFLMFEDVPNEKRLYRNDYALVTFDKYRVIKNLVSSILATRFNPPIKLSRGKVQKHCKIVSRSLVDYLKQWS